MMLPRMAEQLARAMLPLMDDPAAFDGELPVCTGESHDWSIEKDKRVEWRDRYAHGSVTYTVAIVCAHCDFVVGIG